MDMLESKTEKFSEYRIPDVVYDGRHNPTAQEIKISVITLVYNTGKYVVEAINSLHRQWDERIEHVIVDDSSSDNSVAEIKSHLESTQMPALLLRNSENIGISASKNLALEYARGEFIVGLDDDIFLENRVEHDLGLIEKIPDTVAVITSVAKRFHQVDSIPSLEMQLQSSESKNSTLEIVRSPEMLERLKSKNSISAITTCIRASVIKELRYSEGYIFEDYPTWIRIAQNGHEFAFSSALTTLYRRGEHSVSNSKEFAMDFDTIRVGFDHADWQNVNFCKKQRDRWVRLVSCASEDELNKISDWCLSNSILRGLLLELRLRGMSSKWSWRIGNIVSNDKVGFHFLGPRTKG